MDKNWANWDFWDFPIAFWVLWVLIKVLISESSVKVQ
nr:MAG TPA: hypothetical protein [Caudoviricetes sp.]